MKRERIIYFDQNKWIQIAQAVENPEKYPETYSLLECLIPVVELGGVIIPLSATNIYETHKINDVARRGHLAWVQSTLSRGRVFRGRTAIVRIQVAEFLSRALQIPFGSPAPLWFLSDNPFEFAGESFEKTLGRQVSPKVGLFIEQNPAAALHSFLTTLPDEERRAAVQKWSTGSKELIARMKKRQALVQSEPMTTRIRAYCANLLIDDLDLIFRTAADFGIPVSTVADLPESQWRAIVKQVGIFDVEVALATRIEFELREVDENDLRDVSSYTTAICFSDAIVGERATISRARQAKLDTRYAVKLFTSLEDLRSMIVEEGWK